MWVASKKDKHQFDMRRKTKTTNQCSRREMWSHRVMTSLAPKQFMGRRVALGHPQPVLVSPHTILLIPRQQHYRLCPEIEYRVLHMFSSTRCSSILESWTFTFQYPQIFPEVTTSYYWPPSATWFLPTPQVKNSNLVWPKFFSAKLRVVFPQLGNLR